MQGFITVLMLQRCCGVLPGSTTECDLQIGLFSDRIAADPGDSTGSRFLKPEMRSSSPRYQ